MIGSANSAALLASDATQNMAALAYLKSGSRAKKMTAEQLDAAAKDFEAMFLSQMLSSMFGESTGESLFGSKESKEIYRSLLLDQYGRGMAKNGGIGIASYVRKELLKLQEMTP